MWLQTKMDISMSNRLSSHVFSHVMRQDPEFFHSYDPGRLNLLINTLTAETQMLLRQLLLDPPLQLIIFFITVRQIIYNFNPLLDDVENMAFSLTLWGFPSVSYQVKAGHLVPYICVFVIGIALLSPYFIAKISGRLRAKATELQEATFAMSSLVTSVGLSPEEIQLMEAQPFFSAKYNTSLQNLLKARLNQQLMLGSLNVLDRMPTYFIQVMFIGIALLLTIMATNNHAVASGNLDMGKIVGSIVAILGLSAIIMAPVQSLSRSLIIVSQSWPSAERIFTILDRKARSDDEKKMGDMCIAEPSIEVKNVTFGYSQELPFVFKDLTFKIPPAKRTALIAGMGQGKTTFFRLVLRFYDPQQGQILMGGIPTRSFTQTSIRRQVGMMSQFPAFFHASLRENLLIAKLGATDEELMAVCEKTRMLEIMKRRDITLDTPLVGGQVLSGGERKILALTRILLRDPNILFLDEPTTGVDNNEKFKIMEMLAYATKGKTVVVVDHDVNWLLQFCENFIGMQDGHVMEQGTAEEVLKAHSLIFNLYSVALGPKTKEISRYVVED